MTAYCGTYSVSFVRAHCICKADMQEEGGERIKGGGRSELLTAAAGQDHDEPDSAGRAGLSGRCLVPLCRWWSTTVSRTLGFGFNHLWTLHCTYQNLENKVLIINHIWLSTQQACLRSISLHCKDEDELLNCCVLFNESSLCSFCSKFRSCKQTKKKDWWNWNH